MTIVIGAYENPAGEVVRTLSLVGQGRVFDPTQGKSVRGRCSISITMEEASALKAAGVEVVLAGQNRMDADGLAKLAGVKPADLAAAEKAAIEASRARREAAAKVEE